MSTTLVGVTTRLRTWLFVAGLTALLIGAGALAGGAFLYVFVALAVLMNLVGYWFSDRIALSASRAQPLGEGEAPELHSLVADLSQRAGIPVPRLYLIPSEQPNAFATGRNPSHSAVAVTQGLLERMPVEQVRAVIAHELAHVRNRDVLVSSIAAGTRRSRRSAGSASSRRWSSRRSPRPCSSSRSRGSGSTWPTRRPRGSSARGGRWPTRSRRSSVRPRQCRWR